MFPNAQQNPALAQYLSQQQQQRPTLNAHSPQLHLQQQHQVMQVSLFIPLLSTKAIQNAVGRPGTQRPLSNMLMQNPQMMHSPNLNSLGISTQGNNAAGRTLQLGNGNINTNNTQQLSYPMSQLHQQQINMPIQTHVNTMEAKQTLDKYTQELKKLDDLISSSTNPADQQRIHLIKQKLFAEFVVWKQNMQVLLIQQRQLQNSGMMAAAASNASIQQQQQQQQHMQGQVQQHMQGQVQQHMQGQHNIQQQQIQHNIQQQMQAHGSLLPHLIRQQNATAQSYTNLPIHALQADLACLPLSQKTSDLLPQRTGIGYAPLPQFSQKFGKGVTVKKETLSPCFTLPKRKKDILKKWVMECGASVDETLEKTLLKCVDVFLEESVRMACLFAKNRQSTGLGVDDMALAFDVGGVTYGQGYERKKRKCTPTSTYTTRSAFVKKIIMDENTCERSEKHRLKQVD